MSGNEGVLKVSSSDHEVCKKIGNVTWRFSVRRGCLVGDVDFLLHCDGPWETQPWIFAETMGKVTIGGNLVSNTKSYCKLYSSKSNRNNPQWIYWDVGRCNEFEMCVKVISLEESVKYLPCFDIKQTQGLVKAKFSQHSDISASAYQVSLLCPLSKTRMQWPCASMKCKHIEPFDGKVFLKLNKAKRDWACPICNTKIEYEDLRLDEYFQNLLQNNPYSNTVTLRADGGLNEAAHMINLDQEVAEIVVKDEVVIQDDTRRKNASESARENTSESLLKISSQSQKISKSFKVHDRLKTMKKMVVTSGVEDLILKGKQKFRYAESQEVRIVLEEDGTEIDDDESLLDLDRHTLLVLIYAQDSYTPQTA